MTANKSLVFQCDGVEIREQEYCIVREGKVFAVEPRAFGVLVYLLKNPRRLIKKEELLQAVWGDVVVTENSLARAILKLRQVLNDDARFPRYIETVSRIGYRFVGAVSIQIDRPSSKIEDHAFAFVAEGGVGTPSVSPAPAPIAGLANPPGLINGAASRDVRKIRSIRRTAWRWIAATSAAPILILGSWFWYLSRPLPPPRITAFTEITFDGHNKQLGGTDGSRVYFTQSSPDLIAQVGVNGGEIAPLPVAIPGTEALLMDISPDGSRALISDKEEGHEGHPMWVTPILGGSATRLGDGEGENFSPDGNSVIYSTYSGDIFTIRIDGSDKRKLASMGSSWVAAFSWSPDGKVIRFTKRGGGLWEMSSDGIGLHPMLPGWKGSDPCCGQWTQDGRFFLFVSDGQLWALDERRHLFWRPSSAPIQLTSGPLSWAWPIPGKDGKRIFAEGFKLRGELARIDPKTGSSHSFLDAISAEDVSFSPDGKFVSYVAFPEGTLWKANRDGSARAQITLPLSHPVFAMRPRWSPDSTQIVFQIRDSVGHGSIHRVSAADGSPRWLMSEESADMSGPDFSPDGSKVAFGKGGALDPTETIDLRIVDLKTRQVTILPGSAGKFFPRWSPDGRYIAAVLWPQVNHLPVFDLQLQQWLDLPVNGEVEYPSFSHDSKFIYFLRYGKDQGVFRIRVVGGKEERVVDLSGWHLTGRFGYYMSLDTTDAPIVMRDVGTHDLYALTLEEK